MAYTTLSPELTNRWQLWQQWQGGPSIDGVVNPYKFPLLATLKSGDQTFARLHSSRSKKMSGATP